MRSIALFFSFVCQFCSPVLLAGHTLWLSSSSILRSDSLLFRTLDPVAGPERVTSSETDGPALERRHSIALVNGYDFPISLSGLPMDPA